jgi:hypothetical protein
MKTTHNTRNIITLVALTMLPIAASSVALAQSTQVVNTPTSVSTDSSSKGKHHHEHQKWANLTKPERKELKSALREIKQNPELVAAKQAVKDAQTKEEKKADKATLKQLKHDLLSKEDPSLESILAKIKSGKKGV